MSNKINKALEDFWQQGVFDYFLGLNNLHIHYAQFDNIAGSPIIVISPGRCESYLKYQETIFELFTHGFSIFILDHRGQGLSDRMLSNPHKGYVEHFDDYANDLHQFITTIVLPASKGSAPYLLAHSMGSAISLRMLQLYPNTIQKAALLSPMIAINTGVLSHKVSLFIINLAKKVNAMCSKEPWYFFGQTNYKPKPFRYSKLTHNKSRYESFVNLYKKHSKVQLGGVTIHWLYEAFKTEKNIFNDLKNINIPLIILQAGKDCIVDNKKQNVFCEKLYDLSPSLVTKAPVVIEGAYHELLFENDNVRSESLSKILQFFDNSKSG